MCRYQGSNREKAPLLATHKRQALQETKSTRSMPPKEGETEPGAQGTVVPTKHKKLRTEALRIVYNVLRMNIYIYIYIYIYVWIYKLKRAKALPKSDHEAKA